MMRGKPRQQHLIRLGLPSAALFVALAFSAPAAHACPVCHSETGKEVRAGLFNEDFAFNVLASVLPFPIFLGIVAAIHGLPARGVRPDDDPDRLPSTD